VLLLFACAGAAPAIDELTPVIGDPVKGTFTAFKNNRFHFEPYGGKEIREQPPRVKSLSLDPPVKVTVKPRGKKAIEDAVFKSYEAASFLFEHGGETLELPSTHVTTIEIGLDFDRAKAHAAWSPPAEEDAGTGSEPEDWVEKGKITIIHFHMDEVMASVRQGGYVASIADKNKGKIRLVKVTVPGWDSEIAKKHGITSVPQFWFYNRRGQESSRLVDRFTGEDIDNAVRAAAR
jgi:hypothetical protein